MGLLALLAGIGAPRFLGHSEFRERFFADEVRAALSYAQELAVASGCEVQLTLDASGYRLRQRTSCSSGAFTRDVLHPATGASGYSAALPTGLSLTSTVSPLVFDALGRARDSMGNVVDTTVSIASRTISVTGETGFVQ